MEISDDLAREYFKEIESEDAADSAMQVIALLAELRADNAHDVIWKWLESMTARNK